MARVTIRTSVLSRRFCGYWPKFLRILGDSMDERFLRLFYLSQDEEGRKEGTLSRRTSRNTGGGGDPLAGYIESRRISLVAPQRLSRQLKGQT